MTDANLALMSLYLAVAGGWDPPQALSEQEYAQARGLPDTNPIKAFAGFGCSFGAKWFGGFARSRERNFASSARTSLQEDVGALQLAGVEFGHLDFLSVTPRPTPDVIYCDPPYRGTEAYSATGDFDHDLFYARVLGWAEHTDVFVSEYAMPFGRPVLEFSHTLSVAGGQQANARTERLYHYGPGVVQ